jgi:TolB-like protein/Tfp pilus assembly protein PilF
MPEQTAPLKLQLIGQVRLITPAGDATPRSRKAQALLGILALSSPGPITRSRLASLLWERAEPGHARNLLRGAVHEIQRSLGGRAPELIDAARDHLTLRRDKLQIDTIESLRQPRRPGPEGPPLMEGLEAIGPVFQAWLSTARITFSEHLRAAASELRHEGIDQDEAPSKGQAPGLNGPREKRADALKQPYVAPDEERRGSAGIRVGVGAIRCFGLGENDPIAIVLASAICDALARFRWISVVSSDTVAASLASGGDVATGRDRLDLDYIVEGQLFRDQARVRLRTSLISVREQTVLATFKSDRLVSDLLTFEDELAAHLAASIDAHIQVAESRRAALASPAAGAHGLLMHAIALVCRLDQFSFAKASSLLDRALELEPEHVSTRIGRAQLHMVAASQGWVQDLGAALQKAEEEATIALALDPFEARALSIAGHVRSLRYRQPGDAVDMHRQALELNPGSPFALHFAAANDLVRGDLDGARASLERHRQLVAPTGQHLFVNSAVSLLHLLSGDNERVVQLSRAVLHLNPGFVAAYKPYLAALGHLGLSAEAKVVRARLLRLDPTFSTKSLLAGFSFRRAQDSERFASGLRRAGCL